MSSLSYDLGLKRLWVAIELQEAGAERAERKVRLATLEARLHKNRDDERIYGPTDTTSADWARIVGGLNKLSFEVLADVSFNDLCRVEPTAPVPPEVAEVAGAAEPVAAPAERIGEEPRRLGEELRRSGHVHMLAELFNTAPAVNGVLAEAGIPKHRLPPFGHQPPLEYWEQVWQALEAGLVEGGFEALLRAAARAYPYHRLLRRWAV
jgi:hypothetical protein